MKILRTDGRGQDNTNPRLKILRKMISYYDIQKIDMLHDHEGNLTVIWKEEPFPREIKIIENAWSFFQEFQIEHKIIILKEL